MSQKFRNVCFTIFTPTWSEKNIDFDRVKYVVFQYEKGHKSEHPHYQGYAEFTEQYRLKTVKEILGDETAHIEKRMGSQKQAIDYCKKDDGRIKGPWEFGDAKEQGKRTDLIEVAEKLKNGIKTIDIIKENTETYIKYSRGIEKAKFWLDKENATKLREINVIVVWGAPGIGKSKKIWELTNGMKETFKLDKDSGDDVWFDGYDGENTLWIDDFHDSWFSFTQIKQLLDRYPLRIKIKGSYTWAQWTNVIISANEHPREWYPGVKDVHKEAVLRRLTHIEEIQEINEVSDVSEVIG